MVLFKRQTALVNSFLDDIAVFSYTNLLEPKIAYSFAATEFLRIYDVNLTTILVDIRLKLIKRSPANAFA